jgi:hypothetical protein
MKSVYYCLMGFVAFCMMGDVCLAAIPNQKQTFHAARTTQEKTLAHILQQSEKQEGLMNGMLERVKLNEKQIVMVRKFFTPNMVNAWQQENKRIAEQDCGGAFLEENSCGFDYDPLLCAQDDNDGKFIYRTEYQSSKQTLISMQWDGQPITEPVARYRLIKSAGQWKLDGVACAIGGRFN